MKPKPHAPRPVTPKPVWIYVQTNGYPSWTATAYTKRTGIAIPDLRRVRYVSATRGTAAALKVAVRALKEIKWYEGAYLRDADAIDMLGFAQRALSKIRKLGGTR